MRCPIVLAADSAYAIPLATTLRSLAEANERHWPLDLHVLSHGLSAGFRDRICHSLPDGSASISWVPVNLNAFEGLATLSHVSTMTFARLLVADILPPQVTRTLYLDTDLLVLDDLEALWSVELEGAVFGAVSDSEWTQRGEWEPDHFPPVTAYFNAGVLLIDLERWRSDRIGQQARDYLARHPDTPFADQDALNVAGDRRWKELDPRWNVQDHARQRMHAAEAGQRAGIVHFVGAGKPWKPRCLSPNAALYDSFRSRTSFGRTRPNVAVDCFVRGAARVAAAFGGLITTVRRALEELTRRPPVGRLSLVELRTRVEARRLNDAFFQRMGAQEGVSPRQRRLVAGVRSANQRAIGNLLLAHGDLRAARDWYRRAVTSQPSPKSIGRYLVSLCRPAGRNRTPSTRDSAAK